MFKPVLSSKKKTDRMIPLSKRLWLGLYSMIYIKHRIYRHSIDVNTSVYIPKIPYISNFPTLSSQSPPVFHIFKLKCYFSKANIPEKCVKSRISRGHRKPLDLKMQIPVTLPTDIWFIRPRANPGICMWIRVNHVPSTSFWRPVL